MSAPVIIPPGPISPTPTITSTTSSVVPPTTAPTPPTPNPPTVDPPTINPPTQTDQPTQPSSSKAPPTSKTPKPSKVTTTTTSGNGGAPVPTPGDGNTDNKGDGSEKKSIVAPVVGAIAGILVLAFFVAVFVMRKRKAAARKRRLDFLGEGSNNEPITSGSAGTGAAAAAIGGAHRPSSVSSTPRPSNQAAHRPIEMAGVAKPQSPPQRASAQPGYNNYQQGYQQVPYGQGQGQGDYQYPDQYQYQKQNDQYDPYYAQHQQQQQQGYYPDQQQGYYEYPDQQQQNQFVAPGPLAHSSPSMSNSSAYPPPPPSTITAAQSSPRTPLAQAGSPQAAYDKNTKEGYAGTQSPARNPQMVPEPDEAIKVPVS
ncbi:hypothetical protein BG003_003655 [Podila horticola]|nr:hypothetical protein BG003_003655 [Podila horticola]